jgi:hypothetical protein
MDLIERTVCPEARHKFDTVQGMISNSSARLRRLESAPVVDPQREESNSEDIIITPDNKLLPKRAVSFDYVEIREYARCLGNNPATTNGPSLSLDWCYEKMEMINLEDYEKKRPSRRRTDEMQMPGVLRATLLQQHTKCSKNDISESMKAIQSARHQRQMCVAMQEFEHWHVGLESLKRKFRRWRNNTSTKREQELLWENAKRIMEKKRLKNDVSDPSSKSHVLVTVQDSDSLVLTQGLDDASTSSDSSEPEIKEC